MGCILIISKKNAIMLQLKANTKHWIDASVLLHGTFFEEALTPVKKLSSVTQKSDISIVEVYRGSN